MLETWLTDYGYPVLLVGTFLEGETIMILGGVAAKMRYLSLELVIACGLIGSLTGDQCYFFLGRHYGKALLVRYPGRQARVERVLQRLERHQNWLLLSFRFMYGLRIITPFAIGLSAISWQRFTLLNIIGAGIWASIIGLAGYYFGGAIETVIGDLRHYELEVMGSIIATAGLIWVVRRYRERRRLRKLSPVD
jgi:membrane protein DedA with SNARE-associated domain